MNKIELVNAEEIIVESAPRKIHPVTKAHIDNCFNFVMECEHAPTIYEIADALDLGVGRTRGIIQLLREQFADQDTNLVCDLMNGSYVYSFAPDLVAARPHLGRNAKTITSFTKTLRNIVQSYTHSPNLRTKQGKADAALLRRIEFVLAEFEAASVAI